MAVRKIFAMGAVAALLVSGSAFAATPAPVRASASKSVVKLIGGAPVRASAAAKKESKIAGGGILLAVLAGAAVIGGIVIAADGGDSGSSN